MSAICMMARSSDSWPWRCVWTRRAKDGRRGGDHRRDHAELLIAIKEVRDLAHGLHPTILTEAGLAAAVEALAERTPFPVTAHVTEKRFPTDVEVAAYYVIAEGSPTSPAMRTRPKPKWTWWPWTAGCR